ncbi:hypothetical protein CHS0354_024627 [Potamilus streckersoni]|uniref:Uncharacterized protein n=1 Tax=Potamilus streckersoni TaxID=2493646 RepID=A0AAE0SVI9_9BIVA|nr:hypothetical protein CHS0354_024627 [Potamilus streckersoni]
MEADDSNHDKPVTDTSHKKHEGATHETGSPDIICSEEQPESENNDITSPLQTATLEGPVAKKNGQPFIEPQTSDNINMMDDLEDFFESENMARNDQSHEGDETQNHEVRAVLGQYVLNGDMNESININRLMDEQEEVNSGVQEGLSTQTTQDIIQTIAASEIASTASEEDNQILDLGTEGAPECENDTDTSQIAQTVVSQVLMQAVKIAMKEQEEASSGSELLSFLQKDLERDAPHQEYSSLKEEDDGSLPDIQVPSAETDHHWNGNGKTEHPNKQVLAMKDGNVEDKEIHILTHEEESFESSGNIQEEDNDQMNKTDFEEEKEEIYAQIDIQEKEHVELQEKEQAGFQVEPEDGLGEEVRKLVRIEMVRESEDEDKVVTNQSSQDATEQNMHFEIKQHRIHERIPLYSPEDSEEISLSPEPVKESSHEAKLQDVSKPDIATIQEDMLLRSDFRDVSTVDRDYQASPVFTREQQERILNLAQRESFEAKYMEDHSRYKSTKYSPKSSREREHRDYMSSATSDKMREFNLKDFETRYKEDLQSYFPERDEDQVPREAERKEKKAKSEDLEKPQKKEILQKAGKDLQPGKKEVQIVTEVTTRNGREMENMLHESSEERAQRLRATAGFPTQYESQLLQNAYERLQHLRQMASAAVPIPGHVTSPPSSGPIPGFKTLHEQQASWMAMFRELESHHRAELQNQYEQHQHSIQRLQHQMENELHSQHETLRRKLDVHKEALQEGLSPGRQPSHRDEVQMYENVKSSGYDLYVDASLGSSSGYQGDTSSPRSKRGEGKFPTALQSRSWVDIYKEIREEEEEEERAEPRPLRRSLEGEFDNLDNTVDNSSTKLPRSKPLFDSDGRVSPTKRPSDGKKGSTKATRLNSDKDRSSLSESENEDEDALHVTPGDVSPHVRRLLNNLNEGRSSMLGLTDDIRSLPKHGMVSADSRPRAGVYSNPMPIIRSSSSLKSAKFENSSQMDTPVLKTSGKVTSPTPSEHKQSSVLKQQLERRHQERLQQLEDRDQELIQDSGRNDDVYLSSSTRVSLREKHAKHLADLRVYYENELSTLRSALSSSVEASMDGSLDSQAQIKYHVVLAENRHLKEKCQSLEDEIDDGERKIREFKQKIIGLEKRAKEYATSCAEAQTHVVELKAHVEELQRYCQERDDIITDLEIKVKSQEDAIKQYRKNQDEQLESHRKDKTALQKIVDKYEKMEREYNLLKETIASRENALYESRTEVVELNRIISKFELENKRIGRENDNLRHKITQSMNLSSVQNSLNDLFGSDRSPSPQRTSEHLSVRTCSAPKQNLEVNNSHEDQTERPTSRSRKLFSEEVSTVQQRDINPTKSSLTSMHVREADNVIESTSSPLINAERELYRLRNLMRDSVTSIGTAGLQEPKLQKKYYGSERPTRDEPERTANFGSPRGTTERMRLTAVPKSKPSMVDKVNSGKGSVNNVSKLDNSSIRDVNILQQKSTPQKKENVKASFTPRPVEFSSQKRLYKNVNETKKSGKENSKVSQSGKEKNLSQDSKETSQVQVEQEEDRGGGATAMESTVENALNTMRAGNYVTRPQWEDMYTSMAQPHSSQGHQIQKKQEDRIKERLKNIEKLEWQYDNLHAEKRQLESLLSKIPLHGRVDRHSRQQKEELEERLDKIQRELGSIRMSLKRCNVLKSTF